jgi:hypothetical protein
VARGRAALVGVLEVGPGPPLSLGLQNAQGRSPEGVGGHRDRAAYRDGIVPVCSIKYKYYENMYRGKDRGRPGPSDLGYARFPNIHPAALQDPSGEGWDAGPDPGRYLPDRAGAMQDHANGLPRIHLSRHFGE